MRLVLIGTEYTGKTALCDALMEWGGKHGVLFHLDDHFTIPDKYFLSPEDQKAMLGMPPIIKERFQRFQIYYHIGVANDYEDCLLGGFHIEEAIYGGRYHYPGFGWAPYQRKIETELPDDTILLLLTARPDVIRQRMASAPNDHPVVPAADIEAISQEFQHEFLHSWIHRKLTIDTSDLTPETLFSTFMERVKPCLSERDLLRWKAIGQA
jgi:hypothetical protein